MRQEIQQFISRFQRRELNSNVQKVLYTFLATEQEWLPLSKFRVANAGSRVRDLRKEGFEVQCKTASELGKRGDIFYYRLARTGLSVPRIREIFG